MAIISNNIRTIIFIIITALASAFGGDIYHYFFPKNNIEYEMINNNHFDNIEIYDLKIYNNGKEIQNNIKIYFPIEEKNKVFINKNDNLNNYQNNDTFYLKIDEKKSVNFEVHKKYYILKIKSLKPNEIIYINTLYLNSQKIENYSATDSEDLRVESDLIIGKDITKKEIDILLHKYGFYTFLTILFCIFLWALFFDYFTTKEYKINYYENQIKDNKNNIDKLKSNNQ
jgi:hypothetical protein